MDYKLPERTTISNKATYGKVLNIAGSDFMPGAALLSSVSALKIGCGYVFLCSTNKVIDAVAAQTQNIVFVPIDELNQHLKTADVIEIGCGLSQNELAQDIFKKVIDNTPKTTPLIIDADGLNILSKNSNYFINKNFEKIILTPHPKEASRLLDCPLENVLAEIEHYAKDIAEKFNAITVLKTHNTIIATPDGKIYKNTTGNNSMAKAGSGDVLAGIISGLVAQGMNMYEASCLGTYLHGLSGDIAKNELTEYSVMAEDLISYIPNAIKNYLNL